MSIEPKRPRLWTFSDEAMAAIKLFATMSAPGYGVVIESESRTCFS